MGTTFYRRAEGKIRKAQARETVCVCLQLRESRLVSYKQNLRLLEKLSKIGNLTSLH